MNCLVANINNLKVYITDDEEAFEQLQTNPHFFCDSVGNHEGTVGLHELRGDAFGVIHDLMAQGSQQKKDLEFLVEESDRMTVLIDEVMGGVLDVFLFNGSGEEEDCVDESSDANDQGARDGDWTCLKECLRLLNEAGNL
ncbi:hypothetical protein SVAN01_00580 [Stagonosporopsis vannaccii]|nr:hypothetical protein SVAN01_00580 [Stagonosporopsis vannaccii]